MMKPSSRRKHGAVRNWDHGTKDFATRHAFHVVGPDGEEAGYFSSLIAASTRVAHLAREPLPEIGLPRGKYFARDQRTGLVYQHRECLAEVDRTSIFGAKA